MSKKTVLKQASPEGEPLVALSDWEGKEIPEQEPPQTLITVWQIKPHPTNSAYDACVCRSYNTACKMAKRAIEKLMETTEPEDLADGVTVTVQLIQMRKAEYDAIIANSAKSGDLHAPIRYDPDPANWKRPDSSRPRNAAATHGDINPKENDSYPDPK